MKVNIFFNKAKLTLTTLLLKCSTIAPFFWLKISILFFMVSALSSALCVAAAAARPNNLFNNVSLATSK